MAPRARFRSAKHLFAVFVVVTTSLAAALAWVSWRVIAQDRELERQRQQDRLGQALDGAVAVLLRVVAEHEQQVTRLAATAAVDLREAVQSAGRQLSENGAVVVLDEQSILAAPSGRVAYFPPHSTNPPLPAAVFSAGESAEFVGHDYHRALKAYAGLLRSPILEQKAGALLRTARVYRAMLRPDDALAAYGEVLRLRADAGPPTGGVAPTAAPLFAGVPVDLVARHAVCAVLAEAGRRDMLRERAQALYADLVATAWPLTRGTWTYYVEEARGWLDPADAIRADHRLDAAVAVSNALDSAWQAWSSTSLPNTPTTRLDHWREGSRIWVIRSSRTPARMVALVEDASEMARRWLGSGPLRPRSGISIGLCEPTGTPVVPLPAGVAAQASRLPADTGLPWTLRAAETGPAAATAPRTLLVAGIVVLALLLGAGTFFIGRAITRELEVARMQSDFVAAVSHEFRTPLASICHISEMLVDGRATSDARRGVLFGTLQRESERLRRLVEGLLDFARMDAGRSEYRLEPLELADFLRGLGHEFQADTTARDAELEVDIPTDLPAVRADREALARAVWNLLENAVKYSSSPARVRLAATVIGDRVEVSVQDHGLGIPLEEHARIFEKFARGSSAAAAAVKGTGLGLAMVRHITEAHGGTVGVESRPGEGSTFTIALRIRP